LLNHLLLRNVSLYLVFLHISTACLPCYLLLHIRTSFLFPIPLIPLNFQIPSLNHANPFLSFIFHQLNLFSNFSILVYLCLSLHLVFFHLAYSICITPLSPLPNISQPNCTQLSLRSAAPLCRFGLPACHSQRHFFNNSSCFTCKIPFQYLAMLQNILPCLLSLPSVHSSATFAVPLGIRRPFLQNYP